ncbi:MAG: hypothetical protein QM526_00420 [Alphaproteobacteria bacterium]|nr:hypothetical protein [Alphaproteobacteria bacterium]
MADHTHIGWAIPVSKKKYSKEREIIYVLVGITFVLWALFAKQYVFALLLSVYSVILIQIHRKDPTMTYHAFTDKGFVYNNEKTILYEHIVGYNFIDIPDEYAHMLIAAQEPVEIITNTTEQESTIPPTTYRVYTVQVFDSNVENLEKVFRDNNIQYQKQLQLPLIDFLSRYV